MSVKVTAVAAAAVMTGVAACSSDGNSGSDGSSEKKQSQQSADTGKGTGDDDVRTSGAKCNLISYEPGDVFAPLKGAGTPKYNHGKTEKYGRTLVLKSGQVDDRSGGRLTGAKKGDKLWLTISHSDGKYWQSCGHRTAKFDGTVETRWYLHSSKKITNRWIRACAKTNGKVWCANIGDKKNRKNPDGKLRHWWTDD